MSLEALVEWAQDELMKIDGVEIFNERESREDRDTTTEASRTNGLVTANDPAKGHKHALKEQRYGSQ